MSFFRIFFNKVLNSQPKVVSKIDSFSIVVEKKTGSLLTITKKNPDGYDEKVDYLQPEYYVVKINTDGSNPEYPKREKHSQSVFAISSDSGAGYSHGISYIAQGGKFTHFEVKEEYEDGRGHYIGAQPSPHHSINIVAHYIDKKGNKSSLTTGHWIRESEKPAYEQSMRSPSFCF